MADETCPLFGPLERLRTMLSWSRAFQALVGVASADLNTATGAAAARAHVYIALVPGNAAAVNAARPWALIDYGDSRTHTGGWSADITDAGQVLFWLEAHVAAADADDPEAAHRAFSTALGSILADLETLATSLSGALALTGWSILDPPARSERGNNQGDYYNAVAALNWGAD